MDLSTRLRRLADRIDAYAMKTDAVRRAIADSKLIGRDGGLIAAHNDAGLPADIRAAAGRAAGAIGGLRAGHVTTGDATSRLRIEADELDVALAESSEPTLNDTSQAILVELLALDATKDNPIVARIVGERLRWRSEKRKFDQLKRLGCVKSCRHGYYLTEAGRVRAKRLS